MTNKRTTAIAAVKSAADLHQLLEALRQLEDTIDHSEEDKQHIFAAAGIDLCALPSFGGIEPRITTEVWSWDDDQLLVGVGSFAEWRIVDRQEWDDEQPHNSQFGVGT